MIHAETAALWVMATITTKIKSTTVKGYTGTLTQFGRQLGFESRFVENVSRGSLHVSMLLLCTFFHSVVCNLVSLRVRVPYSCTPLAGGIDFEGNPFISHAVDEMLKTNKCVAIRLGEPPRKRDEPTFYDDHHNALLVSFYDRNPGLDQAQKTITSPYVVIEKQYEVVLPLLNRVLQQRAEMMRTIASRVTPLCQLKGKDAMLRFNQSGTKTYQEGSDPNEGGDIAHWDKLLVHTLHGEQCSPCGPSEWHTSGP